MKILIFFLIIFFLPKDEQKGTLNHFLLLRFKDLQHMSVVCTFHTVCHFATTFHNIFHTNTITIFPSTVIMKNHEWFYL